MPLLNDKNRGDSKRALGAKYLIFVSSCFVKMRELSVAHFVCFLGRVFLFFNFWMIKFTIMSNKNITVNSIIQKLTHFPQKLYKLSKAKFSWQEKSALLSLYTVLCISVRPRPKRLETRVIIKISTHPCYPRSFD